MKKIYIGKLIQNEGEGELQWTLYLIQITGIKKIVGPFEASSFWLFYHRGMA